MANYVFFTILGVILLAVGVFSGINKGVKKTFDIDPAENYYQSKPMVENQSERTSRIDDRNERLMDDVRAKMDRLKRN